MVKSYDAVIKFVKCLTAEIQRRCPQGVRLTMKSESESVDLICYFRFPTFIWDGGGRPGGGGYS